LPRAPTRIPPPLPAGLLAGRSATAALLLCLDYDGTLAEFHVDPARAVPLKSAREALVQLAGADRIALAIVSGRRIAEVRALVGINKGIVYSGIHGLEFADDDGVVRDEPPAPEFAGQLDAVRQWLRSNVPQGQGFWVEDKGCALGLHYRRADAASARALCGSFREFVARHAPGLRLLQLNKIDEVVPRTASKAHAVAGLIRRFPTPYLPVYFGDDVTDEDAFREIASRGIGILVGPERESAASYRVDGPAEVAAELATLARTVTARRPVKLP
jgi:trehalose 6-phosphate phosphatase